MLYLQSTIVLVTLLEIFWGCLDDVRKTERLDPYMGPFKNDVTGLGGEEVSQVVDNLWQGEGPGRGSRRGYCYWTLLINGSYWCIWMEYFKWKLWKIFSRVYDFGMFSKHLLRKSNHRKLNHRFWIGVGEGLRGLHKRKQGQWIIEFRDISRLLDLQHLGGLMSQNRPSKRVIPILLETP